MMLTGARGRRSRIAPVDQDPLIITLRDAESGDLIQQEQSTSSQWDRSEATTWEALDNDQVERIYKRLPPILEKSEQDDENNSDADQFVKRSSSIPAPKSSKGRTIEHIFPPTANSDGDGDSEVAERLSRDKKQLEDNVLHVLRVTPEGDVPMASHLSVTFSQPMCAVGAISQLPDPSNWIVIEPQVSGRFRWLGTQTVLFEPDYRFPMSTHFRVRICADDAPSSSIGARLHRDFEFQFSTPTPRVQALTPSNITMTNQQPVFRVQFNQKIDPELVLQKVQLSETLQPSKLHALKLLSTEEAKKIVESQGKRSAHLRHLYDQYWDDNNGDGGRTLWFTVGDGEELSLGKQFSIVVGPQIPSLEGTRTSDDKFNFKFSTYAPLCIQHHYPTEESVPMGPWTITFNNPIDEGLLEEFGWERLVDISPALVDAKYNLVGRNLTITGRSKGNTSYTVKLSSEIQDVYGQKLHNGAQVTFRVGRAASMFHPFSQGLITLDPTEPNYPHSYSVVVCNVDKLSVSINQVQPEQFDEKILYPRHHFHPMDSSSPNTQELEIGHSVFRGEIDTNADPDEPKEVVIDISQYLQHPDEKLGHLFIHVEPAEGSWNKEAHYMTSARAWIQSTRIAADTFSDQDRAICFTNSLVDGHPLEGVSVSAIPVNRGSGRFTESEPKTAVSDATGVAQLSNLQVSQQYTIIAKRGNDSCIVQNMYQHMQHYNPITWYTAFDRGLYKPGEKIHLKGIVRRLESVNQGAFLRYHFPSPGSYVPFTIRDARGAEIADGKIELNQFGSFVLEHELPDNINLGHCYVEFCLVGSEKNDDQQQHYRHSAVFQVQEFRTPEFKVQCSVSDSKPFFVADNTAIVTVKAEYFAGGALPGTSTNYVVTQSKSRYTPPGWTNGGWIFQKEQFGLFRPLGMGNNRMHAAGAKRITHNATTDASGEHHLCVDFKTNEKHEPRGPATIVVNASVQDLNRQTLSSSTSLLVHPSSLYVGIKPRKRFGKAGTAFVLDVIVTDIRGTVVPDVPISAELIHHSNEQKGNRVVAKDITIVEQSLLSGNVEQELEFMIPEEAGGSYTVAVKVKDPENRTNETSMTFWAQGSRDSHIGFGATASTSSPQEKEFTIVADKDEYEPGDVAQLLVQGPFSRPCELLVLTSTGRIVDQWRHTMDEDNCTIIRIPIKEEHLPRLLVKVYGVSADHRSDTSGRVVSAENVPLQPGYGSGTINLKVSTKCRRLNVDVKPAANQLMPGGSATVTVSVTNQLTAAAVPNAEVSLIAVDEAILSLIDYKLQDPLEVFYQARHMFVALTTNRSTVMVRDWSSVVLSAPEPPQHMNGLMTRGFGGGGSGGGMLMMARSAMPMMKMAAGLESASRAAPAPAPAADSMMMMNGESNAAGTQPTSPIHARTNFSPVAAFIGCIETDSQGVARAEFTLPDNLTRYRVWAIAHTVDRFGLGESHIVASLPLMVRCSLPRFLNFGDQIEATVTVQNQTDKDATVNVVARHSNLQFAEGAARGFKVHIPALDRREVRFSVATVLPGEAKFQCGAELVGEDFADAVVVIVPVYTPSTTEAFATYGEIDGDKECIIQPIARPDNVYANFGGLRVNTSSTILQSLTDSFIYLWEYPFFCVEQISSRIMATVALHDVLEAFNVENLPPRKEIEDHVSRLLHRLKQAQKPNGSFGFWDRHGKTQPYITVHAANAMIQARIQGYNVDNFMIQSVMNWLRRIDQHLKAGGEWFSTFHIRHAHTIRAYALYVLSMFDRHAQGNMGDSAIVKRAKELFADVMTDDKTKSASQVPNLDCLAWIAQAILNCNGQDAGDVTVRSIMRAFRTNCNETAETANFVVNYVDDEAAQRVLLQSNRRTDGIVLNALLSIDRQKKERSLVTKVAKGLLAHRSRTGRWRNTQENVFILLALRHFFDQYESAIPDYVARMWIKDQFVGEQPFRGRSLDTHAFNIPMRVLVSDDEQEQKQQNFIIQKVGKPGRLYYRIGMDYAPRDLRQDAAQHGFTVSRTYEHVSDPTDVQYDSSTSKWKFKLGELVRVRVKISNISRRYHVAMVDWMPAGLEALNPDLATTEPIPEDNASSASKDSSPLRWFGWTMKWYDHTNIRDERVEAFTDLLWEGDHEFSYVARATSAGDFIVPPCKVEEMYSPEIFGRSKSERVVIE